MKKKEITLEDLAGMVQRGFVRMDSRFDRMEAELKEIKSDMSDLKLRIDECVYRFEFKDLEKRVQKLELKLAK